MTSRIDLFGEPQCPEVNDGRGRLVDLSQLGMAPETLELVSEWEGLLSGRWNEEVEERAIVVGVLAITRIARELDYSHPVTLSMVDTQTDKWFVVEAKRPQ